jgi:nitronate monooxygenase
LHTRLTERLSITHPIISAPMAIAATGKLATAVSAAGGLGMIGGGYGDITWIEEQFSSVKDGGVGCGLITWSIDERPEVLESTLDLKPKALFLSFGNPECHVQKIKDRGIPVICQVQTFKDARNALDCGADILVAQGAEAGGHGETRATMSLVPELADLIATRSSNTLLCAAGGIADGRGLAAALMLGADGIVMGSRFWATREAGVHENMHQAALQATGDDTIRSQVMDIARKIAWPDRYSARVLKNGFTDRWHRNVDRLREVSEIESARWIQAWADGNVAVANTFVGEAVALIDRLETAETVVSRTVREAEKLLNRNWETGS